MSAFVSDNYDNIPGVGFVVTHDSSQEPYRGTVIVIEDVPYQRPPISELALLLILSSNFLLALFLIVIAL